MAAKKVEKGSRSNNLQKLTNLVKEWGKEKTEYDKLKKVVDKAGKEIKELMITEKLEECEEDGYVAKLSFKHSETFNEAGVLEFIKSVLWADKGSMECPYIKRVEVVDWDAIESALYLGTITKEQALELDKFKEVKETPVLNIGYIKED